MHAARAVLLQKRTLDSLPEVRLEKLSEGLCAQVLHVGPCAAEKPTIEGLHAFIRGHGLDVAGPHHEICMGDPARAAPSMLKTIVRQPVRRVEG